MNSITLYSDNVPDVSRQIWASVQGTTLRVELQDLGDNVPDGEYEYGIKDIRLSMLRKHLKVVTNDLVCAKSGGRP